MPAPASTGVRRVVPPLPTPQKPAQNTGHLHCFVQVATPLGIWYLAVFRLFLQLHSTKLRNMFFCECHRIVSAAISVPAACLCHQSAFFSSSPKGMVHLPTHLQTTISFSILSLVTWMRFPGPPVPSKNCVGGGGQDVAALEQLLRQAMSYALGGGMLHSIRICGIDLGPTSDTRRCDSCWLGCEVPRVCV